MTPLVDLTGQTAVVTGGARGIGLAIVRRLASLGCRVAIWDVDPAPLGAPNGSSVAHRSRVDVANADAVGNACRETVAALGTISILVNNAGVNGPVMPTAAYPVDAWQRVIDVDLTGVFLCCRAVIPGMVAAGYGRIVNISSISGKEGNPNVGAYSAAKAGVIALSKSIAKELAETGVTINCLAPAITETDLLAEMTPAHIAAMRAKIPMNRFCTVDEIAAMTAFVASPACGFTTGAVFDLTGGRATY
jgi:3-oxoacyl-[acyl-carrier protein] reductase